MFENKVICPVYSEMVIILLSHILR